MRIHFLTQIFADCTQMTAMMSSAQIRVSSLPVGRDLRESALTRKIGKPLCRLLLVICSMAVLITPSFAQPISSTELIEKAKEYSNTVVEYQGEVVGDVMVRGDFAWVNLNDGKTAIGVFGKKDLIVNLINYKGGYNYKGDILKVKGVFHRACPKHGGDLDIHIDEVIKVRDGYSTPHPIDFTKVINAFGLSMMALGLSILCALNTRKKRWKKD